MPGSLDRGYDSISTPIKTILQSDKSMIRFIAAFILLAYGSAALAEHPNVIVVMTDDQGYGDFACHGNPIVKTPNIDRFASQSIRMTDFHAAPMCTPLSLIHISEPTRPY